jgi:hypothetical protein
MRISRSVGAIGSDRTGLPVPACRASASRASRIVPNRSAPTLNTEEPGCSPARMHASARSSACTNW